MLKIIQLSAKITPLIYMPKVQTKVSIGFHINESFNGCFIFKNILVSKIHLGKKF